MQPKLFRPLQATQHPTNAIVIDQLLIGSLDLEEVHDFITKLQRQYASQAAATA